MTQISNSVLELFELYLSQSPEKRIESLEIFDRYVAESPPIDERIFAKIRAYLVELLNK